MSNLCFLHCLPNSGSCFMFRPSIVMMWNYWIYKSSNVGSIMVMVTKLWNYWNITIFRIRIQRFQRWTGMIKVINLMAIDHLGVTLMIFIQELNIIHVRFMMITNNNIHIRLVPVFNLVPTFRMISK